MSGGSRVVCYKPVMRRLLPALVLMLACAACGGDGTTADTATSHPAPSVPTSAPPAATTSTTPEATTTTTTTTTVAPRPAPAPQTAAEAGMPWWNDRVFYEVFVRSFQDSDGDGIGDLRGLIDRLDYLNDGDPGTDTDLGITGIWLMPVFDSPSYHGYDVTDYRSIEDDYGDLEDFEDFLAAAHERGIAVIVDLVLNHSSREHPWFTASAGGDPGFAEWYLWSDTDPGYPGPWGQQVWHPWGDRFYYGLFWEGMPDLNLESPAVTAEMKETARYWLEEVGVDGFRVDAARHFIEDGPVQEDTPATRDWLAGFRAAVRLHSPEALILGEVWAGTEAVAGYLPTSLDLAFEFELAEAAIDAVNRGDGEDLAAAQFRALEAYPAGGYAAFLTNHDMERVISQVGGDPARAGVLATLLLTNPGVPFVYYGEEIGLAGRKPDPSIRTPMPWTGEGPGVGFTTGDPWQRPHILHDTVNVTAQDADPDSLLSRYRSLIRIRSEHTALRYGELLGVGAGDDAVAAFLRTIGDDHVLVLVNLGPNPVTAPALDLPAGPLAGVGVARSLLGPAVTVPQIEADGGFAGYQPVAELGPYATLVIALTYE